MRIPAALHIVAGVGVVLILGTCLVGVDGRKEIKQEKKKELAKPQTNTIQSPSLLNFFKRLLPDKAIDKIRAAVTKMPVPKAKSIGVNDNKTRSLKNKKTLASVKETKSKVTSTTRSKKTTTTSKPVSTTRYRLRSTVNPKLTTTNKVVSKLTKKTVATKPTPKVRKQKTGKELRSRQNSKTSLTSFNDEKPPAPEEMEILSPIQQKDRLRQELVRETEDNCLAKILCGPSSKPKPKQQNALVSDTAYLIKEFFNIFDFTIDDVREEIQEMDDVNKKAYEAEEAEKKKQEQKLKEAEEEEEDEEEDDVDDEEDDIYRKSPVSDVPKKKYTTRTPTSKETGNTSPPEQQHKQSEPLKLEQVTAQPKTKRPKPVSVLEMTTVGDMSLISKPTSTVSSSTDRRGQAVTPSSNLFTSTIVSTSMIGSATLKPIDMPFAIPLKTAKDDGDDDEEEDNKRYQDEDNENDDSTFHRVTLEELVGDIQLSPSDLAMIRRGRSMRRREPRMKVALKDVTKDRYIQAKLREMKMATNETKQLKIAQKVARSMREPRQCRQFTQIAQEVLQTCPLTTEVIRFFNTNLKNGTSIEVKRTPAGSQTQGGGLVVLNNDDTKGSQQAYFVDNSPQVANTKIETDLKNPSIPTSHNQEENQYTVYEKRPNPNPQNANLNQNGQDITKRPTRTTTATTTTKAPTKQPNKEESEEEQDDEGDSDEDEEEDEEDDVTGRREKEDEEDEEEVEDDTASREDDDAEDEESGEDEYDGSEDNSSKTKPKNNDKKVLIKIKESTDHNKLQGIQTNQPNVQLVVRPKPRRKPTIPTPTLPPGVIRVYGVPQESFDREFTQLTPIGKPVNLFGDEFLDSPPYKRRRQLGNYGYRTSKKAKNDDDEDIDAAENVAYNARVPKHPPLEPYSHDGDDDDDDVINKQAYQNPPKKYQSNNGGIPLGGIKGADVDDDDDDDKKRSSEKTDDDDDKDNSAEQPPVKISSLDEPPFAPSVMYSVDVHHQGNDYYGGGGSGIGSSYGAQNVQYHNQYPQHPNVPGRRPHAFRPLVRPIKIVPDVNVPLTGVNFRPSRDYLRPGRLYPLYH